jgi:uncharacterized membrane protein YphA (DoxX/SURF4 family)
LLWLRVAVAFLLIRDPVMNWEGGQMPTVSAASGVAGLCLSAGVMTPVLGVVAAILEASMMIQAGRASWPLSVLMISVLVALAILGPGAYSVDAWLFGRKRLTIGRPGL